MTLKAFTTTAASALVLVAATAGVATGKTTPHHKVTKPGKATTTKVTKPVIYTAPFGPNAIVTPQYVYVPAGTPDPNAPQVMPGDCGASQDYCTPEDLCQFWGEC